MSTVVKDLGAATAYGYAVEKGYTGTEAEFAELMASYATVGQTAVNAAQTATTKASEAATSATTATNKASEATTAATTATNKAAEAQADADAAALDASQAMSAASTATTKASEASQSATTATNAKNDAVTAKTAAQAAQTAAETAEDNAETSATSAAASAASVAGSAAQIETNATDIAQLKSGLTTLAPKEDMLKAFPTDTASGSVASFNDGANVPVKSLIVNIDPVQSGSGDPSPTNVRPISGWSEVNVNACGVNVWDEEWDIGDIDGYTGAFKSGSHLRSKNYIPVLPNTPYYILFSWSGSISLYEYTSDKTAVITDGHAYHLVQTGIYTTGPNTYYLAFNNNISDASQTYNHDTSINYPSTDHDYHPYNGQSINIALGQTVYGGKLDVLSGELVIDRAGVDMGTLNWRTSSTQMLAQDLSPVAESINTSTLPNATCSIYKATKCGSVASTDNSFCVISNQVLVYDSRFTDATAFKTAVTGQTLMYALATPITVTLTPNELSTLLGANNIWSDAGEVTAEYRADPTLYIQRLTEPDADMVADANITSGSYFMVGNTLYKATVNIASGATISPNVNCVRKSLSEALNELNV